MRPPTVVDLFCGCGGVTEGLKANGFRIAAAVDNDPIACATYRHNHPEVHLFEDDINNVNPTTIRAKLPQGKNLDLLVVCAPCQPFSSQTKFSKGQEQEQLILQALRFASVLRPKLIFFENVPGLARKKFATLLSKLHEGLDKLGYLPGEPTQIDAADYGVPQRRVRWIMLATHGAPPPSLPAAITPAGSRITVKDAIADLPSLTSGDSHTKDPLHFARNHRPIALERLNHIPKNGGSRDSLPERLVLACHKGYRGHPDVYGRMRWDQVSPTLTTGCTDITRGRFAHPEDDRAITLREASRLQTFPDNYKFSGCPSEIASQIGNAVPVKLIEAIAATLREAIGND